MPAWAGIAQLMLLLHKTAGELDRDMSPAWVERVMFIYEQQQLAQARANRQK